MGNTAGNVAALWHRHIAHPLARDWLGVVHSKRDSQSLQSSRTVWFTAPTEANEARNHYSPLDSTCAPTVPGGRRCRMQEEQW
jgi:hypothetical protein